MAPKDRAEILKMREKANYRVQGGDFGTLSVNGEMNRLIFNRKMIDTLPAIFDYIDTLEEENKNLRKASGEIS